MPDENESPSVGWRAVYDAMAVPTDTTDSDDRPIDLDSKCETDSPRIDTR